MKKNPDTNPWLQIRIKQRRSTRPLYFTDVLVRTCDAYNLTHKDMMQLRAKLVQVYTEQRTSRESAVTSLQIALAVEQQFGDGKTVEDVLGLSIDALLKLAQAVKV